MIGCALIAGSWIDSFASFGTQVTADQFAVVVRRSPFKTDSGKWSLGIGNVPKQAVFLRV